VFAVGDVANIPGADGRPLPQLGSVALQAGCAAAHSIVADFEGLPRPAFHYRDKGIMAMIGRRAAVAQIGKRPRVLTGRPAFLAWLGVHAYLLSGFRERDYLSKSRATSVIDRPSAARIDWSRVDEGTRAVASSD
jgi:NADH:ubiquinone reductase (H+-translocating)